MNVDTRIIIPKEKITFKDGRKHIEYMAAQLLLDNVIFLNDIKNCYEELNVDDTIFGFINCQNFFDIDDNFTLPIIYNEVEQLYNMHMDDPINGMYIWCILKYKSRPLEVHVIALKEKGLWTKEMDKFKP